MAKKWIAMRFLVLVLHVVGTAARVLTSTDELPHCTKNTVMEGEIRQLDDLGKMENIFSSTQFQMALHETTCLSLKVNDSEQSMLHTLQYLRLEQHYPITGAYRFAIPSISSKCICDCAGGEQHCNINAYNYKNCSTGAICYRTYKAAQSNVGCLSSSKSETCCEVQIDPYKDWAFQALRLNQPDTVLIFRYRIYDKVRKQWRLSADDVIEVPLNRGSSKFKLNNNHRMDIVVGGSRPHRQLEPGMYFMKEDSTRDLRGGAPINDVFESNLDKLGWMRWEIPAGTSEGRWDIRKGMVKVTQAHHVNVEDCKGQKYTTNFNGEQMVVSGDEGESENIDLGRQIQADPWIQSVDVGTRVVKVEHAEGTNILISLTTVSRPQILHHSSQFSAFNGSVQVDRESNRFLNITFQEAKGTLIGQLYSSEERQHMDIVFSVQIDGPTTRSFNAIVSIPSSVNSRRYICFHPAGDVDGQMCKWFEFKEDPLPKYKVAHRWQTGPADCAGCNEIGVENFIEKMDPRKWLDGFQSSTEMLMCIFDVSIFIVICLSILIIFTKCIIPLARCAICIATPPKK
uniref:HAP2-GCS1 domain-containing protein n=1 Tax=Steinernema glaseri TaxID=37863 RepID=A0A1I7YZY5_9BILA